mmetsp:Transcript_25091/g.54722  ORF Transcript_25091/g.54722 Transcript_25091/m.54722 type:complete len:1026 (-) Transcript_25091:83-3160(-)
MAARGCGKSHDRGDTSRNERSSSPDASAFSSAGPADSVFSPALTLPHPVNTPRQFNAEESSPSGRSESFLRRISSTGGNGTSFGEVAAATTNLAATAATAVTGLFSFRGNANDTDLPRRHNNTSVSTEDAESLPMPPLPGVDVHALSPANHGNAAHRDRNIADHNRNITSPSGAIRESDMAGLSAHATTDDGTELSTPEAPVRRFYLPENLAEERHEDGYDSDGEYGPHFPRQVLDEADDDEYDEGEVHAVGTVEDLARMAVATQPVAETVSPVGGVVPVLTEADVKKMKVEELRIELRRRGKEVRRGGKNLLKGDMVTSLLASIANGDPILDDAEMGREELDGFVQGSYWRLLQPMSDAVPEPSNVQRFLLPTIPADEDYPYAATKHDYAERFDREVFAGTISVPIPAASPSSAGRRGQSLPTGSDFRNEPLTRGRPNPEFVKKNKLSARSHPVHWFDAFCPSHRKKSESHKFHTDQWAAYTNTKAMLANAGPGEAIYPDYVNFTPKEIRQHLALYMFQGLNPSPQVEMKFKSQRQDEVQGNDFIHNVMGPNGPRRHKMFKCFFGVTDPAAPVPDRDKAPNHKVDAFLKHCNETSMYAWLLGENVSCDEETQGFQGNHRDKLRITYKKEGDGFQCDAIAENGYTWTFYFRNQPAPKKYTDMGMSPLHARVLFLFDQLKSEYHSCGLDNLYNSAKFCKFAYLSKNKVKVFGVARKSGRGVPSIVKQDEVTSKEAKIQVRGTVKAAVLEGDPACPNLLCSSVYDTKPVHFFSMAAKELKWIVKEKWVWSKQVASMVKMKFLRLSVNDEYNNGMCDVDQADQLRTQYRFDIWMRKRKWWWSIFFWAFQMLLVNSYVAYKRQCELEDVAPMSHYDYNRAIAMAWMDPDNHWPKPPRSNKRKNSVPTEASRSQEHKKRAGKFSDSTLAYPGGDFDIRLDYSTARHIPQKKKESGSRCQLHWYLNNDQYRAGLSYCNDCNALLCQECFEIFHEEEDIVGRKRELGARISKSINQPGNKGNKRGGKRKHKN